MSSRKSAPLAPRIQRAAEAALAEQNYVDFADVLLGIGWLYPGAMKDWRTGRLEVLESAMQINPSRISEAMKLFVAWAADKGLVASEADYVTRTPGREKLRFSQGGETSVESFYRTHWVSPALPGAKRERLAERASRPPELVVISPLNQEWKCHRCGGGGGLLIMEKPGPACLACAGLDDLEYLPAGDTLLTRRAKAKSGKFAVVVRFSKSRRRYERQGLLVEPQALARAQSEVSASH